MKKPNKGRTKLVPVSFPGRTKADLDIPGITRTMSLVEPPRKISLMRKPRFKNGRCALCGKTKEEMCVHCKKQTKFVSKDSEEDN